MASTLDRIKTAEFKVSWSPANCTTSFKYSFDVYNDRVRALHYECCNIINAIVSEFNVTKKNIQSIVCKVKISLLHKELPTSAQHNDERFIITAVLDGRTSLVPFLWQISHNHLRLMPYLTSITVCLKSELAAAQHGEQLNINHRIDLILTPWCAANFIHETVGHSFEADNFLSYVRTRNRDIGDTLTSFPLTVVDDPTGMNDRRGHYTHDDEGNLARKVTIVDQGIISDTLRDNRTARLLGQESNGHGRRINHDAPVLPRMASTVVQNGEQSFDSLISDVQLGLLCVGAWGGGSQGATFVIRPCYGILIIKGILTSKIYRRFNVSGNKFFTLRQIDGIANDGRIFYPALGCDKDGQNGLPTSMGAPHIRIRDIILEPY